MTRSIRFGRGLLAFIAILTFFDTINRLAVVWHYGIALSPGLPTWAGLAILLFAGVGFCLACAGLFFYLDEPGRGHWWLVVLLLPLALANDVVAVLLIPEQQIGVGLVLDVYLVNGVLPLTVVTILSRRSARRFSAVVHSPQA